MEMTPFCLEASLEDMVSFCFCEFSYAFVVLVTDTEAEQRKRI
jgi:hypothetical protein